MCGRAGAGTKGSRVPDGVRLLVFTAAVPAALRLFRWRRWQGAGGDDRGDRGDEPVRRGSGGSAARCRVDRVGHRSSAGAREVQVEPEGLHGGCGPQVRGYAAFPRLKLMDALGKRCRTTAQYERPGGLRHVDHACAGALKGETATAAVRVAAETEGSAGSDAARPSRAGGPGRIAARQHACPAALKGGTAAAAFLRAPRMRDTLEVMPHGRPVRVGLGGLRHVSMRARRR